jgi:hypothetical protein
MQLEEERDAVQTLIDIGKERGYLLQSEVSELLTPEGARRSPPTLPENRCRSPARRLRRIGRCRT